MPLFTVFQPCLSHFELLQDTIYNIRYMNITFTIKSLPFARVLVPMYSAPQTKYQRTPKLKSLMRPENQELHVGNDTHMLFSVPSDDPMLSLRGPTSFFFSLLWSLQSYMRCLHYHSTSRLHHSLLIVRSESIEYAFPIILNK